jgi:hypothetical protein
MASMESAGGIRWRQSGLSERSNREACIESRYSVRIHSKVHWREYNWSGHYFKVSNVFSERRADATDDATTFSRSESNSSKE